MGTAENLVKLRGILSTFANLIREGEGTDAPISVADMRQKIAAIDIATFNINNGVVTGHIYINGTADSSDPEGALNYFRKLLTNFADKVRTGSAQLNIDNINIQKDLVCGCHKENGHYGLRLPESITSISANAFNGCSSLASIVLPEGVTSIGYQAFYHCSSLASINIPNGVTSIGRSAFFRCSSLTSINIPEGVASIDYQTFYHCSSLTSINIPNSVTSIGSSTFNGCISLTSINIPNSVTSIGEYVFADCWHLASIVLPNGVTSIGSEAFKNCNTLASINIPNSVTSIGAQAFQSCSSLASIVLPEGVTSIGYGAFNGCNSLTSINIPEGVTSIDNGTLSSCTKLASIVLPESITSIGASAFQSCISLTSINIPNGVTSIGARAFEGCNKLASINIPDGVASIGHNAFYNCIALASINIPASVQVLDGSLFGRCYDLQVTIDENNQRFVLDTSTNCITDPDGEYVYMGIGRCSVPETTVTIGENAFTGCSLSSIDFPNSLRTIKEYAFYDLGEQYYGSITLPRDIEYVEECALPSTLESVTCYIDRHIDSKEDILNDYDFMNNIISGIKSSNWDMYIYILGDSGMWSGRVSDLRPDSGSGSGY